ncbi:MAG: hypothetical protein ACLUI3_12900 [Christensenellales bacterium]
MKSARASAGLPLRRGVYPGPHNLKMRWPPWRCRRDGRALQTMREVLKTFRGVEHRMKPCASWTA